MMFKLVKKEVGKALTVFNVVDGKGGVCGSVNVQNEAVPDFLKHWKGPQVAPTAKTAADKVARSKAAIVAAFRKGPRLSRQAILRGS